MPRMLPCPKCRHPEYDIDTKSNPKADFICKKCENRWQKGKFGREYRDAYERTIKKEN